jgi:hypothetical protein
MNRFTDALQTNDTVTENLMTTHSTSLSALVDFFGIAGSARNMELRDKLAYFTKAYNEEKNYALKLLFWARDVRGGAGERQLFRDLIGYLAKYHTEALRPNIPHIPEYGRWDDVLELFDTKLERDALNLIAEAIKEGNGLCAKWMPRKGPKANKLRAYFQVTPKFYRKTLVKLTNVVEQLMCSNEFEAIDYSKLPSLASARYQKAFEKHDPIGYHKYVDALTKGETKISASAVYPYDVVKSLRFGNIEVANAQWLALPDYLEGSEDKNILPVVDVSGSMLDNIGGGNKNTSRMDVSISLGMYLSERNRGAFKDYFITFSGSPKLQKLSGSLSDRYNQLRHADWGMNTNIEATFKLILNQAIAYNVPQEDMPDQILILSDMQFDQCTGGRDYWSGSNHNCPQFGPNVVQMAKQMYAKAGYKLPNIVFWNLRAVTKQSPVQITDTGVALVSGFSPAIMKAVLTSTEVEEVTPLDIMMEVINSPRYENIHA